jgi:hypothetical protein
MYHVIHRESIDVTINSVFKQRYSQWYKQATRRGAKTMGDPLNSQNSETPAGDVYRDNQLAADSAQAPKSPERAAPELIPNIPKDNRKTEVSQRIDKSPYQQAESYAKKRGSKRDGSPGGARDRDIVAIFVRIVRSI